jgi:methionyl-tRNA synthetase
VPADQASSRLSSAPIAAPDGAPLTPSATAQAQAEGSQTISIDDFAKVDLRVAQVLVAERVPKADKLLRLEVDLGYEKRQILAGIAQHYEPEKLVGRKIVIVANLAPRKMRGLESNGMLLAASLEGGAPVLAGFLEDVPLGARLK